MTTIKAMAKKRTIGTMKSGLDVKGAVYGDAVALTAVLKTFESFTNEILRASSHVVIVR